jgi:hypothetical protein
MVSLNILCTSKVWNPGQSWQLSGSLEKWTLPSIMYNLANKNFNVKISMGALLPFHSRIPLFS